jgi:PAS domain S-box-containing protein
MPPEASARALKLAALYFGVAAAYIVVSGYLVQEVEPDPDTYLYYEIIKGLGFVLITSILLFLITQRLFTAYSTEAQRQSETELALRSSRDQLAAAQKVARLGSWEVDLRSGYLEWSDEVFDIFGVDAQSFGHSLDDFMTYVHADDRSAMRRAQADTLAGDGPLEVEHRVVRPDGSIRYVFERAELRYDETGSPVRQIGTVQDITERKQVALELEKRNRQQTVIAQLGMEALNQTDIQDFMDHAMSAAARTLDAEYTKVLEFVPDAGHLRLVAGIGWQPGLVGGASVPGDMDSQAGYTLAMDEPVVVADLRTESRFSGPALLLEHGVVSGISTIIYNGTERWGVLGVHTTRRRQFSEAEVAFVQSLANLIGNVLQRDRAARAIEEHNLLRQLASEAASLGGWAWDLTSNALSWSEEVARIHEVPPDFTPDVDSGIAFFAPEHRNRIRHCFETCSQDGTPYDEELQVITAKGRRIWVRVIGKAQRDGRGRITQIHGAIQDISERRGLESMLHQSQRLEAVGQLTGGIAHDFNNLLTVILGNADLLVHASDNEHVAELARTTRQAAERGAELTNQLLAYARKQPLEPQPTDVNKLLHDMDALLRRSLGEKVELELVCRGGAWKAMVDPARLESAVLNLCLNARDAMPDGGRLTVETANAHLDDEYARQQLEITPGQYVMIAVSDTGHGVPPELADRVFEPFFTTKPSGQGSGLGLSMVYGFAKQSRGHVRLYSEDNEGTTVKLYLPRTREDAAVKVTAQRDTPRGNNETVLVVEDDDLVRQFVSQQVVNLGYQVLTAANASQALVELAAHPEIALLFTDVVMPGDMDGRQLADAARQDRPDLPVLFTSGYTENAIVHQGRLDPGVMLLNKPYRLTDLAEKLRQALS